MLTPTLPKTLRDAALAQNANVGQVFDSAGAHVAYFYRTPGTNWRVYRNSVRAMLVLLRQVKRYASPSCDGNWSECDRSYCQREHACADRDATAPAA